MSHEEDAALYTKGNGRLDKINGRIFCCIMKEWKELEGMNSGIKLFFHKCSIQDIEEIRKHAHILPFLPLNYTQTQIGKLDLKSYSIQI